MPLSPVATVHLFAPERAELLALLRGLKPAEWLLPTACVGWSVKDIAAHLIGDDAGRLGRGRDGWTSPTFAIGLDISTYDGLVAAIDRQNAEWVHAFRRVSAPVVIDMLELVGARTLAYFESLDLEAPGAPVDWAGPGVQPVWFDVAREYTERWMHHQHIREATGRPGLIDPKWLRPLFETFAFGLARPLAGVDADEGSILEMAIEGDAGGSWFATRGANGWDLARASQRAPATRVTLDPDTAWRRFTNAITPAEAAARSHVDGDPRLAAAVFETLSILA